MASRSLLAQQTRVAMPSVGCKSRRAFTLIEAMVATTVTVLAGSAILLGIASSIQTTDDVRLRTQAAGMAELLMDEIAGQMYCQDPTVPYQYPLGAFGVPRTQFDDIDDYEGYLAQPPLDRFSVPLGTEDRQGGQRDPNFRAGATDFAHWQQAVTVYYVDPNNQSQPLPAGQTSQCRAVEVSINLVHPQQGTRRLAQLRRVFTYVPIQ
jgi:type II secretory pathway pseudopilin PulG